MQYLLRQFLLAAFAVTCLQLPAQQPAYYETLALYKDASELLDKEKYGAAELKFGEFLRRVAVDGAKRYKNDMIADARFSQALCNFHLLRDNAMSQFEYFMAEYPTHSRVDEAMYYIGRLYFIKKDYFEALPYFDQLDASKLSRVQKQAFYFYLGYCHYKNGKIQDAMTLFARIKNGDGPYAAQAAWFYTQVSFENGRYEEALAGLKNVDEEAPYAKNAPLIRASCLLKLERFEELDAMADELNLSSGKATASVFLIFGNAAYERNKYDKAVEYLENFEKKRGRMDRNGHYRLGYSYYQEKDFANARKRFDRVVNKEDGIAQNAWYYLGHCNLKIDDYEHARTAFKEASSMDFYPAIAEEALWLYSKACFETKYMEDALAGLQEFNKKYPESKYKDEANGLVGEILLYTSNYKDAIEYFEQPGNLKTRRAKVAYQRACYFYGVSLFEQQAFDKAASYFKKAYNQRQDQDITLSSYFWYAESLFQGEDFEGSVDGYNVYLRQRGADKHTYNSKAHYGLAWSYLKQKNYKEAGRRFEKFIALADRKADSDLYIDAYLRAGDCEYVANRYSNALNYYLTVRDFNDKYVDYALFRLGMTYFRLDNYEKSVNNYLKLVSNFRRSEYRDDGLINLSEIYLTWLNNWQKSAQYARSLIRDHPNSPFVPGAYMRLGIAEYKSNNNKKATDYFKKLVFDYCYDTKNAVAALQNLSSLLSPKEYDRIESQYQQKCPQAGSATAGNKEKEELDYQIAQERFFDENYDVALTKFDNFLRNYPNSEYAAEIRFLKGEALEKKGNESGALAEYKQLYESGPVSSYTLKALNNAAEIHFKNKEYLASTELFKAMEEKADKLADRLTAQFGKAKNLFAQRQYDAALGEYQSIFTHPNTTNYSRTRANVQIAACMYHLGKTQEAFDISSKIEKDNKNSFGAEAQYWITRILYDRGELDQSRIAAIYLKDNYPSQNYWKARAFLVLAEVYLKMGDTLQAVNGTLKTLAEQDRYPEIREQALARMLEIQTGKSAAKREDSDAGTQN